MLSAGWAALELKRSSQLLAYGLVWIEVRARNHRHGYAKLAAEEAEQGQNARLKDDGGKLEEGLEREHGDGGTYVGGKRRGATPARLARSGDAKPSCTDTPTQITMRAL